jgi:solute carrier family 66, member 2
VREYWLILGRDSLITSPLTSYTDQILSIHKSKSSQGFSLDIPLIMLTASILKVYYWFGTHFDTSLLVQAVIMIGVQGVLLKVALENRPSRTGVAGGLPFRDEKQTWKRPGSFWQWRAAKNYYSFLTTFTLSFAVSTALLSPTSLFEPYTSLLGYVGLAIEAMLPVPQLLSNASAQSCKGFRFSVLISWLLGDVMKMIYFFRGAGSAVPWSFKACGLFQMACDIGLGLQYAAYGEGPPDLPEVVEKEREMSHMMHGRSSTPSQGVMRANSRDGTGKS